MKKASGTDSKRPYPARNSRRFRVKCWRKWRPIGRERALAKSMLPVSERGPARAVTNLKQAAEICNCSVEKLRKRCERGEIPAEIVDHQWAIDVESHTAWRSKAGRR
jgi:hypothetical protein